MPRRLSRCYSPLRSRSLLHPTQHGCEYSFADCCCELKLRLTGQLVCTAVRHTPRRGTGAGWRQSSSSRFETPKRVPRCAHGARTAAYHVLRTRWRKRPRALQSTPLHPAERRTSLANPVHTAPTAAVTNSVQLSCAACACAGCMIRTAPRP